MIVTYLKELTRNKLLDESVRGYRGGYLPSERRVIEKGLRDGTIQTVVSTNALELGVDIGQLQACIMTGYREILRVLGSKQDVRGDVRMRH